jgi:glyoxylase-like metal-dependent hydrolase (beta-lactamase superfamily II)
MIVEILPGFYKVEIPAPDNHSKATNSHIIKSEERSLIIDTGVNREKYMKVMHAILKKLKIEPLKADFFVTHSHPDHFGLTMQFATETSCIYLNQKEAETISMLNKSDYLDDGFKFVLMHGYLKTN